MEMTRRDEEDRLRADGDIAGDADLEHVDDEYNEEEDEDFVPNEAGGQEGGQDDDQEEEEEEEEGDEGGSDDDRYTDNNGKKSRGKKVRDYSKIESETGGLVKTRRGRQLESEYLAKHKYENMGTMETQISPGINTLWESMQNESDRRLQDGNLARHSVISEDTLEEEEIEKGGINNKKSQEYILQNDENDSILIERTYNFAGETIKEKKWVPRSSAMAKEYLNSLKFKTGGDASVPNKTNNNNSTLTKENNVDSNMRETGTHALPLRRPLKRKPILEDIIAGSLKPKLTTLEKSKLDWVEYIDKEGIQDELQLHNKDGYLAKQDFLNRIQSNEDAQYKEMRQKQLALQLQEQSK